MAECKGLSRGLMRYKGLRNPFCNDAAATNWLIGTAGGALERDTRPVAFSEKFKNFLKFLI